MGLWVTLQLCVDLLGKNLGWAKMAQKWDFSTILKDFVINLCLKQSSCTNPISWTNPHNKNYFLEL